MSDVRDDSTSTSQRGSGPLFESTSAVTLARELIAPILALEQPTRSGWRLIGWDFEQGISLTLVRGDSCVLIELERRDESRPCFTRTARFNMYARRAFRADLPLNRLERGMVELVASVIREREPYLPAFERPAPSRRAEVREIKVDKVLVAEGEGHYYINPYSGCMIGCEFCYVAERADLSRELEGLPSLEWGRWAAVKINAPEVLRHEINGMSPGIVRMSPILTDPYQPLERRYKITRGCLEVLLEGGFFPVILTRAALVTRDLDLLSQFERAAVGLSIPTDIDRIRHLFEPGADPIEERIEALAACKAAGLHTFVCIQPILPMDPDRLVEQLAPIVDAVRIDRMHEMARARTLYESAGLLEATTEEFFENTGRRLREGFAAHGIHLDELDDLARILEFR